MKETTLGQVKDGSNFWFGGIEFTKDRHAISFKELCQCKISGTTSVLYIVDHAWVKVKE